MIELHCPKVGNGRPPVGMERTLRMYFVRHCCDLADAACEDALLDCTVLRRIVGIDLGREGVPNGTTLLKFRRLLGEPQAGRGPAGSRHEGRHWHDRGRHDHRRAQFDQERRQAARPAGHRNWCQPRPKNGPFVLISTASRRYTSTQCRYRRSVLLCSRRWLKGTRNR